MKVLRFTDVVHCFPRCHFYYICKTQKSLILKRDNKNPIEKNNMRRDRSCEKTKRGQYLCWNFFVYVSRRFFLSSHKHDITKWTSIFRNIRNSISSCSSRSLYCVPRLLSTMGNVRCSVICWSLIPWDRWQYQTSMSENRISIHKNVFNSSILVSIRFRIARSVSDWKRISILFNCTTPPSKCLEKLGYLKFL